ncbi:unnamed protein product [Schistosoma rodhaini]|uniref:SCP domain-containing protein n=1 Tax=Schistosoma rodhaini TaxID=6188 RepID=A0AA85FBD3_9TREM|nr:unnamed protein product [Schistosoma rodhaini]
MPNDFDIEFNEECINEHNRLRALHGCPALILNYELAKDAQKYAEHLASVNELEHCTDTDSGENLAFFTTTAIAQKKDFTVYSIQFMFKIKNSKNKINNICEHSQKRSMKFL